MPKLGIASGKSKRATTPRPHGSSRGNVLVDILRVAEGIAALGPHRPARARLAHAVLRCTASLTGWYRDGRCVGPAEQSVQALARTAASSSNSVPSAISKSVDAGSPRFPGNPSHTSWVKRRTPKSEAKAVQMLRCSQTSYHGWTVTCPLQAPQSHPSWFHSSRFVFGNEMLGKSSQYFLKRLSRRVDTSVAVIDHIVKCA
jgi:hypothetical protein